MRHTNDDIKRLMEEYEGPRRVASSLYRDCRKCGRPFKKSRTNSTVNCTRCRLEIRHANEERLARQRAEYVARQEAYRTAEQQYAAERRGNPYASTWASS